MTTEVMAELQRAGKALKLARKHEREATSVAWSTALLAAKVGTPETQIAKALGVDRMTVRKWLGK